MHTILTQYLEKIKQNKTSVVVVMLSFLVFIILLLYFLFWKNTPTVEEKNPFGDTSMERATNTAITNVFDNPGEAYTANNKKSSVLQSVTSLPVIGGTVFEKKVGGNMVQYVRYTSHANGHMYEKPLTSGKLAEKISNKTSGAVSVSLWSANGNSTVTRYYDNSLQTVYTYVGYFAQRGTSSVYRERRLAGTITDITLSPDGTQIFYLEKTPEGLVGYTQQITGGERNRIWSSVLHSISASWEGKNVIALYTKPTSVAEGVVWGVHPVTGEREILLAGEFALEPLVNPEGTELLYSKQEKKNKQFDLGVLHIISGKTITIPLATMVNKCAWGPVGSVYIYCAVPDGNNSGSYLEEWYMGITHSNDTLWRINSTTGEIAQLIDPHEETGELFDIVNLSVSPKEDYLLFRTRNNSILWRYQIPETKL